MWLATREDAAESDDGSDEEQESPYAIRNAKGPL